MVQTVVVTLEDDLDGGPAKETVRFGLDGREYEIDLNGKNAKGLRRTVETYVRGARKKAAATRGRPAALRRRAADIRAWAQEQGHMQSERGRIPDWVVDEYDRVHRT